MKRSRCYWKTRSNVKGQHAPTRTDSDNQVKWFISETPVGYMKEHLVRHGSKHKIQVHTTKRNKRQQKQNPTHFQNKKQPETRERSLTKTKARGKNENRWVQQTYTLTYTDTRLHIHPPTDSVSDGDQTSNLRSSSCLDRNHRWDTRLAESH